MSLACRLHGLGSGRVTVPSTKTPPFFRHPQLIPALPAVTRLSTPSRSADHSHRRSMRTSATPELVLASVQSISVALPWAALGAIGLTLLSAIWDAQKHTHLPHIQYPSRGDDSILQKQKRTVSRCPSLLKPYKPVPFLTNRHVETIFASKFRKSPTDVHYIRQILTMQDGGSVALDWEHKQEPDAVLPANAPVLILLPGLTGGSGDSYVMWAVQSAAARGFRAVVFNSRGTSDSPVTTPQYYSASFTGDMRAVVNHVHNQYPDAPIVTAGWSLGANIMMRYLGEEGDRTPVKAAVAMCNPFDLTISNRNWEQGFNIIYDRNLAGSLKKIHQKHEKLWQNMPPPFDMDLVANCKTVREFDQGLTIHSFGWPNVDAYYAGSSSSLSVPHIRIPTLCIQALDDPIAPEAAIPFKALAENPYTVLVTTTTGGHLGWCAGDRGARGHPWSDRPMIEWLDSVLREQWPRDAAQAATGAGRKAEEEERPVVVSVQGA